MKWRIVAFDHPDQEKSVLYRHCSDEDALLKAILDAVDDGANLISIRGFDEEPDPEWEENEVRDLETRSIEP